MLRSLVISRAALIMPNSTAETVMKNRGCRAFERAKIAAPLSASNLTTRAITAITMGT